jgi:hypothetical protein
MSSGAFFFIHIDMAQKPSSVLHSIRHGSITFIRAVVGRSAPKGLQTKARGEAPGIDEFLYP